MTAFEWPSIDMGPFFERLRDSQFLPNDFIVNSMNDPNPRWIFGYQVVGLMKLFNIDWHSAFLLMKSLVVVFIPGFLFLFFVEATKALSNQEKLKVSTLVFAVICIIFIFFSRSLQYRIMIGDYLQSELKATPHSLAILWGLIGAWLLFRNSLLSFLFLFLCTLTHPAVGFIFFCINIIFQVKHWRLTHLLVLALVSVALPFGLLLLIFSSTQPLPLDQLIEIYIRTRLPHHYDVSTWSKRDLVLHMSYFIFYFCFFIYLFWRKNKRVVAAGIIALVTYVGAIFSQYLFINVIPFRPVVLLGPVRLTAFTFTICAPFLLTFLDKVWALRGFRLNIPNLSKRMTVISSLVLLMLVFLCSENDPLQRLYKKSPQLYKWVNENTKPSDVFVAPLDILADEFVLIAKRSVYISQIFPFSEELYPEYQRRWHLIYGPIKSLRHEYFKNQSRERWVDILNAEKIDYIVLPKNQSYSMAQLEPAFESEKWVVISRDSILAEPNKTAN